MDLPCILWVSVWICWICVQISTDNAPASKEAWNNKWSIIIKVCVCSSKASRGKKNIATSNFYESIQMLFIRIKHVAFVCALHRIYVPWENKINWWEYWNHMHSMILECFNTLKECDHFHFDWVFLLLLLVIVGFCSFHHNKWRNMADGLVC